MSGDVPQDVLSFRTGGEGRPRAAHSGADVSLRLCRIRAAHLHALHLARPPAAAPPAQGALAARTAMQHPRDAAELCEATPVGDARLLASVGLLTATASSTGRRLKLHTDVAHGAHITAAQSELEFLAALASQHGAYTQRAAERARVTLWGSGGEAAAMQSAGDKRDDRAPPRQALPGAAQRAETEETAFAAWAAKGGGSCFAGQGAVRAVQRQLCAGDSDSEGGSASPRGSDAVDDDAAADSVSATGESCDSDGAGSQGKSGGLPAASESPAKRAHASATNMLHSLHKARPTFTT